MGSCVALTDGLVVMDGSCVALPDGIADALTVGSCVAVMGGLAVALTVGSCVAVVGGLADALTVGSCVALTDGSCVTLGDALAVWFTVGVRFGTTNVEGDGVAVCGDGASVTSAVCDRVTRAVLVGRGLVDTLIDTEDVPVIEGLEVGDPV